MVGTDTAPEQKMKVLLVPLLRTAAGDATQYADLLGFDGCVLYVLAGAIAAGTAPTYEFEVKDSPDHTTWTAVDNKYLTGTEPTLVPADANKAFRIGYKGPQRYVQYNLKTVGGTPGTGGTFATVAVLNEAGDVPVTQD